MIEPAARSADGKTFTLFVSNEQRRYTNDKAGRRRAILDGLNAIETIAVGQDVYLPSNNALQVVAAVLYPDGIQTEAAYQTVCRVTENACAHLGYGVEEHLGPPAVPFSARGAYRKRYPAVDEQMIQDELALAGTSSDHPRQEVSCAILWNKAGLDVYGNHWSKLTPSQQAQIQAQVDGIVTRAGWHKDASTATVRYTRPLPIDEAAARRRLDEYLRGTNGRPVAVNDVVYQAQLGAYGRAFFTDDLAPSLQAIVTEVLQAHGYRPTPEDGTYRPMPVTLAPEAESKVTEKLAAIPPGMTRAGPALLLRDVLSLVKTVVQGERISQWQAEQLIQTGAVSRALRQLGYQTTPTWLQPTHFQPPLDDDREQQVILKEVRVQLDTNRKLRLAKGLPVYTPAVVLDSENDDIIYLEMVGHKQAVRANWAALVGKKVRWIGRQRVYLEGMKAHVLVRTSLPCGWVDYILIHKQASIREMNPEEPFFLLDDGRHAIPPLFYPMLNKCLAVPLLEEWAAYLWENGRERNLIALLNGGAGQGYAAWRVLPAPQAWQELVQDGLSGRQIRF